MRRSLVLVAVVAGLFASSSCNRRVFKEVKNQCERTLASDVDVPVEKAADILIVVDNSGSMLEEQQNLVANFLNQDGSQCPLQDLKNIPAQFRNPVSDLYTGSGPLARCGFIQLLAAFENDFRVGVITTDVGLCDNPLPSAQAQAYCEGDGAGEPECEGDDPTNPWGFRPQRGCLQPDGPPGAGVRKLIAAADLQDDDVDNDDFAQRFKNTLDNIRTFGSPYERGLDAMALFLDPDTNRGPGCADDLSTFRRDDAALVVIFLSDEEDCSHGLGDNDFADELVNETCGPFEALVTVNNQPKNCYVPSGIGTDGAAATLSPVSLYKTALLKADPDAKVAVIAGGLGEPDAIEPAGCLVGGAGPEGDCFESGGNSNFTGAGGTCSADKAAERGNLPCCVADRGSRYYELADAVGNKKTDSICNGSFRSTMLDIAAFIGSVDSVTLAEPPASTSAILVELTRAGSSSVETIPHLDANANCATETGWLLEGQTKVVLCGEARPGPGDQISVRAKGGAVDGCAP